MKNFSRKGAKAQRKKGSLETRQRFAPLRLCAFAGEIFSDLNMIVNRRNFLGNVLAAGAVGLLAPRVSRAAESSIEILINEPIGKILPDIYSHFIEHLGGVIYDGIWVGEKSKVQRAVGISLSTCFRDPAATDARVVWI